MFKKVCTVLLMMLFCLPLSFAQKSLFSGLMKKVSSAKEALFKKSSSAAKPAEQAAAQAVAAREGASAAARTAAPAAVAGAAVPGAANRLAGQELPKRIPWNIDRQYRAAANIRQHVPKEAYATTFLRFERTSSTPVKEWFVNGENVVFASRAEVAKYMAAIKQGMGQVPVEYGLVKVDIEPAFELQNVEYKLYADPTSLKTYTPPSAMDKKAYRKWKRNNVNEMIEKGEGIDWQGINDLPY